MPGLGRRRSRFITQVLLLVLSLRGRLNFLQLARLGPWCERTFRRHFTLPFDWLGLNLGLAGGSAGAERVLILDPSFLAKSGQGTYGLDRFWSGCSGAVQHGLEAAGLAVADVAAHTAYHLLAAQTPPGGGRMEHYAWVVTHRAAELRELALHLAVDGFFYKKGFADAVRSAGLHLVGLMRVDAELRHAYQGEQKPVGRPRKYAGRVDVRRPSGLEEVAGAEKGTRLFTGVVWSMALGRKVRLALVHRLGGDGEAREVKVLYSTDLGLAAEKIVAYYRLRFQVEFLFRDAKQHAGLAHCQARAKERLDFHLNASLTAVSLAKLAYAKPGQPFSMADVKTLHHNRTMLERVFSVFGFDKSHLNNKDKTDCVLNFGRIAA
nr:transposase [Rufibacter quisquiliarum]